MTDLLPCPFCGDSALLQPQQGNNPRPFAWHVIHHCLNGFMRFGENCNFTEAEAIAAWNRRAPAASPAIGPSDRLDRMEEERSQSRPKSTLHGANTEAEPAAQGEK